MGGTSYSVRSIGALSVECEAVNGAAPLRMESLEMRDWSGVPYPAWWVERAARRRAELDAAVDRVRAAVRRTPEIVGALVYGSYATGRVGPDSDLDLMVVTTFPVVPADPGERYVQIRRILDLRVPSDVLVYAPDEFARLRSERSFVAQAWREGVWIDAAASG